MTKAPIVIFFYIHDDVLSLAEEVVPRYSKYNAFATVVYKSAIAISRIQILLEVKLDSVSLPFRVRSAIFSSINFLVFDFSYSRYVLHERAFGQMNMSTKLAPMKASRLYKRPFFRKPT